ncbi:MAG: RNA methyltransferase [Armatimonadota bacterium]|nr:RNA methyltransferase [Armatimonadota bacterium]
MSGQKDPAIVLLRELTSEEGRRTKNLFFVEGQELVNRAFDFGASIRNIILSEKFAASELSAELLDKAAAANIPVYAASEGLLAKILEAKPTPECLAVVERRLVPLEQVFSGDDVLAIMVEAGENADNLGMLLRSADAAGVCGVILAADTVDPFCRRAVRGSRGAVFTLPICIQKDSARVIKEAHAHGVQVVASSARAEVEYTHPDLTKPTLIIVGNEHRGITETVRSLSDVVVRIPMLGRINSLNIAVAASILLYEAVRQRRHGR